MTSRSYDNWGRPLIAIVGLSGVFPGARNLDEFWTNLVKGVDSSCDVPEQRWAIPPSQASSPKIAAPDHVYSTRGYFLNAIPPIETGLDLDDETLKLIDPSVRLAIALVNSAWDSANTRNVDRSRVGVMLGNIALPTEIASGLSNEVLSALFGKRALSSSLAARHKWSRFVAGLPGVLAAKALNLGLGALCFDAACASSLYALKYAMDELRSGRADAMIAGGLSRPDCFYTQMGFAQLRALSLSGRCSPFDASADGLVVGEGGGAFVLKRLSDAERDGDAIHGVICGIGLSNDQDGNVLAPASEGQLRALRDAYSTANWSPADVDFIECHATGTPVGDRVEYQSLSALWGNSNWKRPHCVLGAVKASVGHLLTGAGAAGLCKVLLAMRNGIVPPMGNFDRPSNYIAASNSQFRIPQSADEWTARNGLRRAAVNAFGFGGINAHLLVEEYSPRFAAEHITVPDVLPTEQIAIVGFAYYRSSADSHDSSRGLDVAFGRFPIPPSEFSGMMPQQLIMLQTAAHAVADAGIDTFSDPNATGVFIGCNLDLSTTDFHYRWVQPKGSRDMAGPPLTAEAVTGHLASVTASRIARTFRLGGPSFCVSSETTSLFDAIGIAIGSLHRREINLAIVGAADTPSDPRVRATQIDGEPPRDCSICLVLQRLADARESNRQIHATCEAYRADAANGDEVRLCGNELAESIAAIACHIHEMICASDRAALSTNRHVFSQIGIDGVSRSVALTRFDNPPIGRKPATARPIAAAQNTFRVPLRVYPSPGVEKVILPTISVETAAMTLSEYATAPLATARAHGEYLRLSQSTDRNLRLLFDWQNSLFTEFASMPAISNCAYLDRQQCLEFAVGNIGDVLGPPYAQIDAFPTRVRLPDEPLMLVDRIIAVEGEPLSLSHGRVVTEHDVTAERWYLGEGNMPTCIAVESGQADLFLSGYLGIDLRTQGEAVYRLLDAVVTFHSELPQPEVVVRYDIHIDRFFRQGNTHLFRFRFEGTVDGRPLLTMTDGCAGFFTETELAAGQGIVHTSLDRRPDRRSLPADWVPLAPFEQCESYDDARIDALRTGDLPGCFGPDFATLDLVHPTRLPGDYLRLVHRVSWLEPNGGRFGLGLIRAEADVRPDDWYLTCHFVDDQVMPGTLMYECCLHTLRIFLMRLGWVGERDRVSWQPIPGVASRLKCRGQVTAKTQEVCYEVSIKQLGYRPEPFAIADVLMYADGKPIVEITDMSLRLVGTNRDELIKLWRQPTLSPSTALFDHDRILEFAIGQPSKAFGDQYRVFDEERQIARLPGPPYQFLDRIVSVGAEPWVMRAGGNIVAEYDVPADAWYFEAARRDRMPFAIMLEVALQPCGWLAAYIGSALTSSVDLRFRNLGGRATQHRSVDSQAGRLTTHVSIDSVSSSGGMIIQHYAFAMRNQLNQLVYDGTTYFGFFSQEALANQIGIKDVRIPTEIYPGSRFAYPNRPPFADDRLRMIDEVSSYHDRGGSKGLGSIEGRKKIDPEEWFFKAHFYQDPVVPGSLGLESLLQLLQVVSIEKRGESGEFQAPALGHAHEWQYRGQILPEHGEVTVWADITNIDQVNRLLVADGLLAIDGRVIYRMTGFTAKG